MHRLTRISVVVALGAVLLLATPVIASSSAPSAVAARLATSTASATSPFPPLPAPTYKTVAQDVAIPMDDGVKLGATVTFPSFDGKTPAPGKFPVVLSITPYGRVLLCSCPDQTLMPSRGIISAVVDTRGTGGSEGTLDANYFSPREARDGYELVEYFGTQPYSTGKVGMWGGSYVGITQYLTAEQRPPHLAAIAPAVALADLYRDAYAHGGIMNLSFDTQYLAVQGAPGLAGINGAGQFPLTLNAKISQALAKPIALDYLARPDDDAFYQARSPYYGADKITVPVLILDGWHDGFIRGAVEMYGKLAQRPNVETRLYVDPCTHKGCGAPFAPTDDPPGVEDSTAMTYEFLSHYLRGTPEPPRPNVRVWIQQQNSYVDSTQWPLPGTTNTPYYLRGGAITATASAGEGSPSYTVNPSAGLSMALDQYGTVAASPYVPLDQRLEAGKGLTWRTPPAVRAVTLAGPTQLHLVASSTAADTDWVAKLSDVAPNGAESIITEGYLRASHRQLDAARSTPGSPYHTHVNPTPIAPDTLFDYDIGIWPTAYQLPAGHRLQLRLTTDDFPTHYPGTVRVDPSNLLATQLLPMTLMTNTVHEGGNDPSSLLLPIEGGVNPFVGTEAVAPSPGSPRANGSRSTGTPASGTGDDSVLAFTGIEPWISELGLALVGLALGATALRRRSGTSRRSP